MFGERRDVAIDSVVITNTVVSESPYSFRKHKQRNPLL